MRFNENANLDTSNIDDLRGGGRGGGGGALGGRVAAGGGGLGILGLILYFLISQLGGGSFDTGGGGGFELPGGLSGLSSGQTADTSQVAQSCRTGADANTQLDCEVVAVVNSLDGYWTDAFARSGQTYQPPRTNFFSGGVNTACGSASSAVGPFYCPGDNEVYIDLSFFQELETTFGAQGGTFARAYVMAHEYGHHIQALLGTTSRVRSGDVGPTSGSVRLELQADCYAGVWANHATTVPTSSGEPLIVDVTREDVAAALDTAARIGDDFIQTQLGGGQVDESQFSHGSSAQRELWYTTGYETGDPSRCDTFARGVDLG
ncbi:KPN_02809 family neutral zinc metallopeptidase [Pseudonocardia hydrocarbonoxydans]|uniref:Membrane protein n=1 Tax=Pseudonocardia hydrocarbonoxydans TaxID=76726 RepID=A0A4Y3WTC0_9PSEU|nr:neutral zinc metallopeptidase [Pseudonocardia hydrocarbonoxydans]GEC22093.1 membrane protein [Pseudonocardia hydrocarbonoxydans]